MVTATPSQTPNPNALRFSLDVSLPGTISAGQGDAAGAEPLAAAILGIDGVVSVFATADFVTVTRAPGANWDDIVPSVQKAIAEHL